MEELSIPQPVIQLAAKELRRCNELTQPFGLFLNEAQILSLIERRFTALRQTGRIEFGEGVMPKLIYAFCDSPYMTQDNYEETLAELQDSFYYFKGEAQERISDDELIALMKHFFDTKAQGSLEYLNGTTLPDLCRGTSEEADDDMADDRLI